MSRSVPVVVGVAQVVQHRGEGDRDAAALMTEATTSAASDAGVPELLARLDLVLVPEGTWPHRDPGRIVATRVGSPQASTLVADIGVLQTTLLGVAASAIVDGRSSVALVVGGEAKASGNDVADPLGAGEPAERMVPGGEILTGLEIERGLAVPAQSYALQEDAIRFARGEPAPEHRERLARWWSRFSEVAVSNPYAWDTTFRSPDDIADPGSIGNRTVSTPYTKRHCSQWNVDQAVAVLMVSDAVADELGIESDRRVHPVAVVDSNAMITVSARADLFRSPAFEVAGRRLADATGIAASDAAHVELYSCFPSAVQIQASELGIDHERQLTVTGGMAFGGGPLNSVGLHGVAALVDVMRADPGSTGLATAISGMITKGGLSLWSTEPPERPFVMDDVTDEVISSTPTVPVDPDHVGEVVVEAATVAFDRDGPSLTVVAGRTRSGRRVVATSGDRGLARAAADQPPTGTVIRTSGATIES